MKLCWLPHHVCSFLFGSTLDRQLRRPRINKYALTPLMPLSRSLFVLACGCWPLPDPEPLMHGEVQSPQYPQPYPPNLQEQWDLNVPEGYRIRITFTHMDIEASAGCYYDSLTVRATFQHIYSISINNNAAGLEFETKCDKLTSSRWLKF